MQEQATINVLDIDLNGQEFLSDPYPLYDRVRAENPVHWNESDKHWYITRYVDVMAMLKDPRLSSNRIRALAKTLPEKTQGNITPLVDAISSWMLQSDPPSHTRMRGLVNKAFTPRMIEGLRSRIQYLVDGMLDDVQGNGGMDVLADLAVPMPGIVISDMLGVPPEDQPQFKKWSSEITGRYVAGGGSVSLSDLYELSQKSFFELSDYFREIIETLRGNPKDNLLSAMVEAEEAGDKLTTDELIANCVLLMFAGNETTTNLIGNGMLALLQNPEQLGMLQGNAELIGHAVEELLRYDSPVQKTARMAIEDIEIGDEVINAGDLVMLCYGSANRDPEQFEDPNRLDITRADNRHLAFAQGIHYCLGSALARIEGQIAINALVQRLPDIKLAGDAPERCPTTHIWGFKALPVSF
ncbi:MAG: cytochrome P450 [Chloroflexi bacterium]|nr:cytochrome P450 [Chloroflexota bacterium]